MEGHGSPIYGPIIAFTINGGVIAFVNLVAAYDWTMKCLQLLLVLVTVVFTTLRILKSYEEWTDRHRRRLSGDGVRPDAEGRGVRSTEGQGGSGED